MHSTCASLAMSSSSHGAVERGCIDRAADQMTNVPTGSHDGTPDSARRLTPAATVSPRAADTRICCRWLRDTTPPKTERPRQSTQGLAARHSLSQTPVDEHTLPMTPRRISITTGVCSVACLSRHSALRSTPASGGTAGLRCPSATRSSTGTISLRPREWSMSVYCRDTCRAG